MSKVVKPKWNTCRWCKEQFTSYPHEKPQFCSQKCHFSSRRRTVQCPTCGKKKVVQKNLPRKDYCSYQCASMGHRKFKGEYICRYCGINFYKYGTSNPHRYCSQKCFNLAKTLEPEEKLRRMVKRVREYRRKHPELTAKWKHSRRAREMGAEGTFTHDEWIALKEKHENKCAICQQEKKLTVDHIVPLVKGGTNYISNIQPLCMPCNSKKHVKIG